MAHAEGAPVRYTNNEGRHHEKRTSDVVLTVGAAVVIVVIAILVGLFCIFLIGWLT